MNNGCNQLSWPTRGRSFDCNLVRTRQVPMGRTVAPAVRAHNRVPVRAAVYRQALGALIGLRSLGSSCTRCVSGDGRTDDAASYFLVRTNRKEADGALDLGLPTENGLSQIKTQARRGVTEMTQGNNDMPRANALIQGITNSQ